MKRLFDIVLASILILVLTPLLLLLSLWIKTDSSGPIIFTQKRVGLKKEMFKIYKFRTMKLNTPPELATDLMDHKDNLTNSGTVLRKTSLDEIPQLINIIKGEMSLVGPRPVLYNEYNLIHQRDQAGVHSVKPGLTGLAQINGRDTISDKEKVRWDKKYIENMSILFDLKILFFTFLSIFNTKNIKG
ncbi:lipid carrier--UDP-N-acetylgalactosaminyltransferase [Salipaludibacillus keqinensis]|uniref:Lipid carrier--UDP-N-acetylgalactosaminyltransferase n=1 Tax=Salipaludibacillus keqinensis TaxID=2045207 RepID=A0A323TBK4_9BACI|nr:sugar transferase [Salipaludibacillus keqinensis]PYZ92591.1 lipid carrier--UDP-N-acetylgalactosaminyltransferase [Salipaludibacillus keqinensis]